jgi:glycosyltransferase involved in cell wall biosynthesis
MFPEAITAVIPVHNGAATIRRTLDSLVNGRTPPAEIIVVDDGSTDSTAEIVQRFISEGGPCRLLQRAGNDGAAAARNLGTANATTELLLFTDSDVELEPDTLDRLLATVKALEPAAAVGVYRERNLAGGWLSHFTTSFSAYTYLRGGDGSPTNFGSQCVLVRRSAMEAVGGFDQSLGGATVEDLGLGYRLRAQGLVTVLSASARMNHNSRFGLVTFWRNYFVKSRVFTSIRARTPRRFRTDGGYDQSSMPLSILLSGLGWLIVLALPFRPATAALLLLLQQTLLLLLWRGFVGHTHGIFGTWGAIRLFLLKQLALSIARACVFAIRVFRTAKEPAVFTEAVNHLGFALRTNIFRRRCLCLGVLHFFHCFFKAVLEGPVEIFQHIGPFQMLVLDLIKTRFHITRKRNIHKFREELVEFVSNNFSDIGRVKLAFDLFDVLAILYSADDRSVSTRPADALFFQCLYQRRFRISSGWLGKVLHRLDVDGFQRIGDLHRRQELIGRA